MLRRLLVFRIALWTMLSAIAGSSAHAAMILSIEHIADGSVEPPGDRVDVAIALFPGEDSIELELRGFVRLANSTKPIEPLPGRDPRTGTPLKQWQQMQVARLANDQRRMTVSFIIPFRELSLPVGLHRVAFEITGRIGDEVQFVQATRLIPLQVTKGVRTQMFRPDRIPP